MGRPRGDMWRSSKFLEVDGSRGREGGVGVRPVQNGGRGLSTAVIVDSGEEWLEVS